jgi:hypothetical protein
MRKTIGACAAMAGLLVQCSSPEPSDASASGSTAASQPSQASVPARPPRPQLCDEPGRPAEGPRLFLSASLPFTYSFPRDPRDWMRGQYAPESVEAALKLHYDYSAIGSAALRQWLEGDRSGLRASFERSLDVAQRVQEAGLQPVAVERRGSDDGYELGFQSRFLPLQLAYFILVLDQDYSAFESRMDRVAAARWAPDLRSSEFRRAEAPERPPIFAVRNEDAVRAIAVHRLLQGKDSEAEKAMLFVLETRAVEHRGDRFMPHEPGEIVAAARRPDASFRGLTAKAASDAAEPGCSDLFFFNAEWLDMRSRVAIAKGRRAAAKAVALESSALRKTVPPALLGERTLAALTDIERRITRFYAGETR